MTRNYMNVMSKQFLLLPIYVFNTTNIYSSLLSCRNKRTREKQEEHYYQLVQKRAEEKRRIWNVGAILLLPFFAIWNVCCFVWRGIESSFPSLKRKEGVSWTIINFLRLYHVPLHLFLEQRANHYYRTATKTECFHVIHKQCARTQVYVQ